MSQSTSHHEQELRSSLSEASERLAILERQLHALDVKLSSYLAQQARYDLLEDTYSSLEKLNKLDSTDFYRDATGHDLKQQLQQIRLFITGFQKGTVALEHARSELQSEIKTEQYVVRTLTENLQALFHQADGQEYVPAVVQQVSDMPYRILPWTTQGLDEDRFHIVLGMLLLPAILFGAAILYFSPPVERSMGVVVPQRIAKLIKKNQQIKQVEQQRQEQAEKTADSKDEKSVEETAPAALPPRNETEAESSRRSAETKGVLAFKNDLANLLDDSSLPKMGSEALISVNGGASSRDSSRSLIVSRGSGASGLKLRSGRGSGGIDTSDLKRSKSVVGTGQRIAETEIKIARVDSTVISGASERSSTKGRESRTESNSRDFTRTESQDHRLTRTDEEIQLVFDRYKSALYRMYNRELRSNPSLRGRMMLQIVIEPDGSVSECILKSNDFDSEIFASNIVKRVLRFNFGAKANVSAMTILYPIEFLPPN